LEESPGYEVTRRSFIVTVIYVWGFVAGFTFLSTAASSPSTVVEVAGAVSESA
jgi:hypothetical protein